LDAIHLDKVFEEHASGKTQTGLPCKPVWIMCGTAMSCMCIP
jgi:hypothetical protein